MKILILVVLIGLQQLIMASTDNEVVKDSVQDRYNISIQNKHWLSWSYETDSLDVQTDTSFKQSPVGVGRLGYRYQFESGFGISLMFKFLSSKKTILTTIRTEEERSYSALGPSYRWFVFQKKTKDNRLAQSHLLFEIVLEHIRGKYKINDESTGVDLDSNSNSIALRTQYLFPLKNQFWIHAGVYFDQHRLNFQRINLNYNKNIPGLFLGANYAF